MAATSTDIVGNFQQFRVHLDSRVNLREAVVKASRDITIDSKRLIFHLHRYYDQGVDRQKLIQEADTKIELIVERFRKIADSLRVVDDPVTFCRAYSPGMQEFIEAVSFKYLLVGIDNKSDGNDVTSLLLPYDEVKQMLQFKLGDEETTTQLCVPLSDYVLGIADTTGEAMRMCIKQISLASSTDDLQSGVSFQLCQFVRMLHELVTFLSPRLELSTYLRRQLGYKMSVIESNLKKCETECSRSCMALHEHLPFRPLLE